MENLIEKRIGLDAPGSRVWRALARTAPKRTLGGNRVFP
jgi:hypothetical protein